MEKYKKKKQPIYLFFVDFKSAVDCVDRQILWRKQHHYGISPGLLKAIQLMYTETWTRVRLGNGPRLSRKINTSQGLKQGCVLAPCLFNLFLSDLTEALDNELADSPKLADKPISNLLYADNVVLLSQTRIGLQRLINKTIMYSIENKMIINETKTKVMEVSNKVSKRSKYKWHLQERQLEKVYCYKYLGILFDENGSFSHHKTKMKKRGNRLQGAFRLLYCSLGGPTYLPLLRVIKAKLLPSLTYGSEVLCGQDSILLNNAITKTFKYLFRLPSNTSPAQIRLEFGFCNQQIARMGQNVKTWKQIKTNINNPMCCLLWQELQRNQKLSFYKYLQTALKELSIFEIWETSLTTNQVMSGSEGKLFKTTHRLNPPSLESTQPINLWV